MRVNVIIPVFNRLEDTRKVLEALRRQTLVDALTIVVVNDGSTDGTAEYLQAQGDVVEIRGDGNLWWGGAIAEGLKHVLPSCQAEDYILLLNNDTWFDGNYVETLVQTSKANGEAAVGSVIHEEEKDPPIVSIGPRININRFAIWDLLSELSKAQQRSPDSQYRVDALSGRGTLYPALLFRKYGGARPRLLPHYMADYEIAMRFARAGVPLIVSTKAIIYSPPVYGNDVSRLSWKKRLFGRRSPHNVFQRLIFYSLVGSPVQRLTAPFRMAYFFCARVLLGSMTSRFKKFAFSFVRARRLRELRRHGVSVGRDVVLYGAPLLQRHPDSEIHLDDRVVLCSDSRFTALALNHPVKIATIRAGSKISIGADSGISGATIVSAVRISIGAEVLMGANVTIFDTDFHPIRPEGRRHSDVEADIKTAPVHIGDNVFIGTNALILRGTEIGRDSIVAAGAVVRGNFPAGAIIAGNPAKVVGSVYTTSQERPGSQPDGEHENSNI
ncbi:GT2 family glycosyltransferase/carbonic anhydrase/acetyltransferase-like protein (isoleucine patch superfamily) [Rhizobium leguminosarum]|uniref:GT2 family glycosyltransferase/carbonic anhydrase/acetyltransferase-like protein (Isoleucine patch superfamily) n=1 Tax=Rhizobium leguminosarum TaxID=384 RepID=A0AAE2MFP8_RHILE|nr:MULTISPECIES: glycosyltransferase [Rhizobium]MBB4288558.1 GT2 family glycosyltransferase/carbonic anhydrase/acetyltransferase-like protein (isoleucine patch superfamily) [Rhizobium leguminosarum]MBB4295349.1 GT2 family glycosyltransferase/carbonic anhydrase/acetyltransferase-like protein (isoleucine patch superfamily) [Rhizobium leguminosarum]MBB4306742.1 GT2 family glycosyltransferase/carbonic anhydrase/acetyltransferase-like protein (isoleucine patch superfamily) [Rhizobium leguminosarum]M